MKQGTTSCSFRENHKKEEELISSSARINMNNSSSTAYLRRNGVPSLLNLNNSSSHLADLRKTLVINIDILKEYITSNNNPINIDKNIITLLNTILEKTKKRHKIIEKIKEKKSKLLIDNQINSEKRRKNEERRFYLKDKIKEKEERIDGKEEYMKVLHKKMREVEIYIHKNTINIKNMQKRKKYQTFSMFNFIEINNDLIRQRKDIKKQIEINKNSYKVEFEENKKIKEEEQKEKEKEKEKEKNREKKKINNDDEIKIKKISEKYKKKIKLMTLKLNTLKNIYKKVNKKIKILKINELNQIDDKEDDRNDTEQSKFQLDTTLRNSYMDFSVLNAKNMDESKLDMSKYGNISNFGVYDISIIDFK